MELLPDYEYSCILIQLVPKLSHGFLIKVNYSLRLLKFEYSVSMVHVSTKKHFSMPLTLQISAYNFGFYAR